MRPRILDKLVEAWPRKVGIQHKESTWSDNHKDVSGRLASLVLTCFRLKMS